MAEPFFFFFVTKSRSLFLGLPENGKSMDQGQFYLRFSTLLKQKKLAMGGLLHWHLHVGR